MNPAGLVLIERDGEVARVTLNRPQRHNSLVPELLERLEEILDREVAAWQPRALVLAGAGSSFSTGGDVSAFRAVPAGVRGRYARRIVGALHRVILRLLALPCPVIARVQGQVTGGAFGFVLASDLVAMARGAFIAPYYAEVGFAPDGGWTALLPERIGAARAGAIQFLNTHIEADEAVALGLATIAAGAGSLDAIVDGWLHTICSNSAQTITATRALLLTPERHDAIARGLERELERFVNLIEAEATDGGMKRFLETA